MGVVYWSKLMFMNIINTLLEFSFWGDHWTHTREERLMRYLSLGVRVHVGMSSRLFTAKKVTWQSQCNC